MSLERPVYFSFGKTRDIAVSDGISLPMFDFRVLQQAFRIHYEEILNFLNDFIRTAELDDELREAADTYIQYIKFDEVMLRFAPDPTKNTVFELLRQGINWDA